MIEFAILGLLSWRSLSGYDIKKMFTDSATMYWSGNNNQIYRTLTQLHQDGFVSREIYPQENLPARKIYVITPSGQQHLRAWVLSDPITPRLRNSFLIQLAWADQLSSSELEDLLNRYQQELEIQRLMVKTEGERKPVFPNRTKREVLLWEMVTENWIRYYCHELEWLEEVRQRLKAC